MAQNSNIEWTHHTANLWWGCTEVHAGCDNCYARTLSNRYNHENPLWGNNVPRKATKSVWGDFLKYQALANHENNTHRVFVGSMMDIFEKPMPVIDHKLNPIDGITTDDIRWRFFTEIIPNSPNLLFLLLTKRPSNINKYIPNHWIDNPPSNVIFGTSPVDQPTYDTLVPQLLKVNGHKFLSIEPQLSDIKINTDHFGENGIGWVIQGGESGHNKRPFSLDWAYSMKSQVGATSAAYFFKQIDKVKEVPKDLAESRKFPSLK